MCGVGVALVALGVVGLLALAVWTHFALFAPSNRERVARAAPYTAISLAVLAIGIVGLAVGRC